MVHTKAFVSECVILGCLHDKASRRPQSWIRGSAWAELISWRECLFDRTSFRVHPNVGIPYSRQTLPYQPKLPLEESCADLWDRQRLVESRWFHHACSGAILGRHVSKKSHERAQQPETAVFVSSTHQGD